MVEKTMAKATNRELVNEVVRNCRATHRSMMKLKKEFEPETATSETVRAIFSAASIRFGLSGRMLTTGFELGKRFSRCESSHAGEENEGD